MRHLLRTRVLWLSSALAALLTLGLAWGNPQELRRTPLVTRRWVQEFGMVSPAGGQTLRLNVVDLGPIFPPTPAAGVAVTYPPNPCDVTLAFFDGQGALIGQPSTVTLQPGTSTLRDLVFEPNLNAGFPPNPCRAAVWISQVGLRTEFPPDPCAVTLELLNTLSGAAVIHTLPAVQRELPAVQ